MKPSATFLERELLRFLTDHINLHGASADIYVNGCCDLWAKTYGNLSETVRAKAMQHYNQKHGKPHDKPIPRRAERRPKSAQTP